MLVTMSELCNVSFCVATNCRDSVKRKRDPKDGAVDSVECFCLPSAGKEGCQSQSECVRRQKHRQVDTARRIRLQDLFRRLGELTANSRSQSLSQNPAKPARRRRGIPEIAREKAEILEACVEEITRLRDKIARYEASPESSKALPDTSGQSASTAAVPVPAIPLDAGSPRVLAIATSAVVTAAKAVKAESVKPEPVSGLPTSAHAYVNQTSAIGSADTWMPQAASAISTFPFRGGQIPFALPAHSLRPGVVDYHNFMTPAMANASRVPVPPSSSPSITDSIYNSLMNSHLTMHAQSGTTYFPNAAFPLLQSPMQPLAMPSMPNYIMFPGATAASGYPVQFASGHVSGSALPSSIYGLQPPR